MIRELLAVGGGGALGSIARYLIAYGMLAEHTIFGFPTGTFAVNAAGSLVIGILLEMLHSQTTVWLLVVGFCGGFTTFSSFSADAVRLLKAECWGSAALYIALSAGVCIGFAALGMWIGTQFKN